MNYDYLINLFRFQPYGRIERKLSVEAVVRRYALFPNEAIYLIDYKTAQIEPLTKNFEKITGIDLPHKNEITPLYEHVHKESINPFLNHLEQLLKCSFVDPVNRFFEEQDFILTFYKTAHNRVILKSTTILQYDTAERIRYSVGKLMDVTGLLPYHQFSYKFTGPGSQSIYAAFEGMQNFVTILSPREIEILKYVGMGMRSAQIAEKLWVSRHTIDTHKRNIIRKLEAANSIDAFNIAQSMGLFKPA